MNSVAIQRPQRWDQPFDPDMTLDDVERVSALGLFCNMDRARFSKAAPLEGIIQNDTRLIRYGEGDIAIRAGDYGNSAFIIISGAVGVIHPPGLPEQALGRQQSSPQTRPFAALTQLWRNSSYPEVRDPSRYGVLSGAQIRGSGSDTRVGLQDIPSIKDKHEITVLVAGEMFGEIAALARIPRSATVFALDTVEVLEIRWQALNEFQNRIPEFRAHVDKLYRDRSLNIQLKEMPLLESLSDDVIQQIADVTLFENYGEFDWHTDFKRRRSTEHGELIASEPLVVAEGDYTDGLLLIRAGFGRVSRKINFGHQTLYYLHGGDVFGLSEIVHNYHNKEQTTLQTSLRAVGYLNILRIPTSSIEKLVLPNVPDSVLAQLGQRRSQYFGVDPASNQKRIDTDTLEFLVDDRYVNGTATMMIDLDRCVRCDECVTACAKGHNNNPRFNRHGRRYGNYMVANACMHCVDPVCMIGCPTGAIHRAASGQVVINDDTCIGCATCANSCPYDNIRMVEVSDKRGSYILDKDTNRPIVKATKCDLCIDQPGGPACQRACPHDALVRMEMHDLEKLSGWLNR